MSVATEIYAKVTNVLVEVLAVNEDDVKPALALQRDLGADSLDLLEIIFRLEHAFGIEIPRGELFPPSNYQIGPEIVDAEKFTDRGSAGLRSREPDADLSVLKGDPRQSVAPDLLTVGLVADYLAWKLNRGAGSQKDYPASETPHPVVTFEKDP